MSTTSTEKTLNAGAVSFTPGGGVNTVYQEEELVEDSPLYDPEQDEDDDEDVDVETEIILHDIESEMDTSTEFHLAEMMNSATITNNTTSTELPPHLANHASEFWFPQVRDCSCCKGYKHGCSCCKSGGSVCQKCSAGTSAGAGGGGGGGGFRNSGSTKPGKIPCKFFQSSSGCRFGDKCRFSHEM